MKSLMWFAACWVIVIAVYTSVFSQTVSDEARIHFDRGTAAVEMAKSPDDYEAAIKEFKQAIDLAPEWADAYYNLGKVQEKAEKYSDAVKSLRDYLRFAPNASDADEVKSLINKLQYKAENTLTKADIISVLTSLAKKGAGSSVTYIWEAKGNCLGFPFGNLVITRKDEESIYVVSILDYFNSGKGTTYQVLKVDGPTVRFRWVSGQGSFIYEKYETQLDVLSKSRVKVRHVVIMGAEGKEEFLGTGMIFECELSPPK